MKLFVDDEIDCEEKSCRINTVGEYAKYIYPLQEIMKDWKDALCLLPLYPLDAIEEYLKFLVYYKDVSGVRVRLFSEKYLDCRGCPISALIDNWGDEKYCNMIAELKALAECAEN